MVIIVTLLAYFVYYLCLVGLQVDVQQTALSIALTAVRLGIWWLLV